MLVSSIVNSDNYIGETGDVLTNRVTVHKQQIADPPTCMLGVRKHIDDVPRD